MFQIFTCHISIPFKFDTFILALGYFCVNALITDFTKLSRNSYLSTAFSHNPLVFNTKKTLETTNSIISGCSTNPVGEKSPTGFFICKKEKSRL